jgi:hypothetical protein
VRACLCRFVRKLDRFHKALRRRYAKPRGRRFAEVRARSHVLAGRVNLIEAEHIDNLSAGIGPPVARIVKGGPCPVQIADNAPRLTLSTGWPLSIGLGDRFPSESASVGYRFCFPIGGRTLIRRYLISMITSAGSPLLSRTSMQ